MTWRGSNKSTLHEFPIEIYVQAERVNLSQVFYIKADKVGLIIRLASSSLNSDAQSKELHPGSSASHIKGGGTNALNRLYSESNWNVSVG